MGSIYKGPGTRPNPVHSLMCSVFTTTRKVGKPPSPVTGEEAEVNSESCRAGSDDSGADCSLSLRAPSLTQVSKGRGDGAADHTASSGQRVRHAQEVGGAGRGRQAWGHRVLVGQRALRAPFLGGRDRRTALPLRRCQLIQVALT